MESLPEVIMQTVFVIRSVNDDYLRKLESQDGGDVLILIMISIVASLISITNKYVWIDEMMVISNCKSLVKQVKPDFWHDAESFVKFTRSGRAKMEQIHYHVVQNKFEECLDSIKSLEMNERHVIIEDIKRGTSTQGLAVLKQKIVDWSDPNISVQDVEKAYRSAELDEKWDTHFLTPKKQDEKRAEIESKLRREMSNEIFYHMLRVFLTQEFEWCLRFESNYHRRKLKHSNNDKLEIQTDNSNADIPDIRQTYIYLSYGFIIRVIWRLAAVTARFVIISLVWVR